jgi:acetoacetyl-CoA synthetase
MPKCIVHKAAGVLLTHLKEQQLHCDIHPGDTVFYFTTCGWMMWNWLTSALATGATIVLFDGNPAYPNLNTLFDL